MNSDISAVQFLCILLVLHFWGFLRVICRDLRCSLWFACARMCSRLIIEGKILLILVHIPKEVGGDSEIKDVIQSQRHQLMSSVISHQTAAKPIFLLHIFFYSNEGFIMFEKWFRHKALSMERLLNSKQQKSDANDVNGAGQCFVDVVESLCKIFFTCLLSIS